MLAEAKTPAELDERALLPQALRDKRRAETFLRIARRRRRLSASARAPGA